MSDETTEHELTQDQIDDSLADQGFSAEVGTERWVSDLESQFSDDEVAPTDVAVGGDDLPAAEGEAPGGDADYIQLGDVKIPQEEAERVAKFWDWMNNNPDEAMKFVGYMTGEYELVPAGQRQQQQYKEPAPAPQAPAEPAEDPYEDWDLLPDSVQERLKKVDALEGNLAQQQQHQHGGQPRVPDPPGAPHGLAPQGAGDQGQSGEGCPRQHRRPGRRIGQ